MTNLRLSILHVYVKLSHNWQTMRCDIVMLDKMDIRVTLQHRMHCWFNNLLSELLSGYSSTIGMQLSLITGG
jgi:hypothetical protein